MIAGIDYSLSSPAICVSNGALQPSTDFEKTSISYLTQGRKFEGRLFNMTGLPMPAYSSQQERYELIADWAIERVSGCSLVVLEDYSFGSTGRVFHIAENAGLLKYKMYKKGLPFVTIAPTIIKKFATGKGNANKELLNETFISETKLDIKSMLDQTDKQWNPSSDIIDAYYMCRYGIEHYEALCEQIHS
jgi:Holliday junction resolvasome RuvABC endonuclease subunit